MGTHFGWSRDGDDWTAEAFSPVGFSGAFDIIRFGNRFYATGEGNAAGLSATPPPVTYADESDLLNDNLAPAPGHYGYWLAGGYFRLGAIPAGLITADVTEGVNAKSRSPAELFRRVLWQPWVVDGPMVLWVETDLEALYTAITHQLGFWTNEEITIAAVLDLIAMSAGAWWGVDRLGRVRIAQFTTPTGSAVLSIGENQVVDLERLPTADVTRGIPPWRTIVRWGRLYAVQTTDVAGGVTDARRGELAREWREAKAEDAAVLVTHRLAPQVVEDSLLATEAGAQAEATRRQTLRGTLRDVFQFRMELNATTETLELGDVVDLTHSRFGLTNGELCRVIGVEPNVRDHRVQLTVFK